MAAILLPASVPGSSNTPPSGEGLKEDAAEAINFATDRMLSLLEQVSKRLEKNFLLQIAAIFASLVIIREKHLEPLDLPLGLKVPGYVVGIIIPVILIKLMMDWGYESYQYLLTRRYLKELLDRRLGEAANLLPIGRPLDVLLPASMYKFLYSTEADNDKHERALVVVSHFLLLFFIILVAWMNYLAVLYYWFPNSVLFGIAAILYPAYYSLHWYAMEKHLKVWWYRIAMVILIGSHVITAPLFLHFNFPELIRNFLATVKVS